LVKAPDTSAEAVLEILRSRRSMPRVRDEPPPRELVERVIQAGGWAPNHYRTEPWRFVVLTGDSRRELGEVMARSLLQRLLPNQEGPEAEAELERERRKPMRAPVVIAVAAVPSDQPKVVAIEEFQAVAAAAQNMLVAAHALGLGAMWRTGRPAYDPAVKAFLGLPDEAHIVAFVYLGYPDLPAAPERDRDARRNTRWME
jgi:nitroreductase